MINIGQAADKIFERIKSLDFHDLKIAKMIFTKLTTDTRKKNRTIPSRMEANPAHKKDCRQVRFCTIDLQRKAHRLLLIKE